MNSIKNKILPLLFTVLFIQISVTYAADADEQGPETAAGLSYEQQRYWDKRLSEAAQSGCVQDAEEALRAGANPNSLSEPFGGVPPLNAASRRGHIGVVKVLLKAKASVTQQYIGYGLCFDPPLFEAVKGGHADVVKELVKAKADIHKQESEGDTVLHTASYHGHCKMIKILLKKGMDVDVPDSFGRTPLHSAAAGGHRRTIGLLLDMKANIHAADKSGQIPIASAIYELRSKERLAIVELFLEIYRANKPEVLHRVDVSGDTLLHIAARRDGEENLLKYLLNTGLDPYQKNHNQESPFYISEENMRLAIESIKEDIAGILLVITTEKGIIDLIIDYALSEDSSEPPALIQEFKRVSEGYKDPVPPGPVSSAQVLPDPTGEVLRLSPETIKIRRSMVIGRKELVSTPVEVKNSYWRNAAYLSIVAAAVGSTSVLYYIFN